MNLSFSGINYWAVLTAGLLTFLLGGLWYQALFGKLWVQLHGFSEEKVKQMQEKYSPAVFFSGMIVAYLVISFVMAVLFASLKIETATGGALFGFLIWIAPVTCIRFTDFLTQDRPIGIMYIDSSYQLIFLVMTGAILGGWH